MARQVLDKAREKQEPIFHIQHISRPGAPFFLPDTPGAEIHPVLAPRPGELVIHKHYPNSFRETTLLEELRKRKISRLYICAGL